VPGRTDGRSEGEGRGSRRPGRGDAPLLCGSRALPYDGSGSAFGRAVRRADPAEGSGNGTSHRAAGGGAGLHGGRGGGGTVRPARGRPRDGTGSGPTEAGAKSPACWRL